MKIAIIGSHNVGKTSLAEELLEHLPDYSLEIEPYYQLEASGYDFSEIPSPEDFVEQFNFSSKLILQPADHVIFDRCVLDIMAYLYVLDPFCDIQSYYKSTQTIMSEIDLLVFVPIEDPDRIEEHQITFPKLRGQVDEVLHNWVDDFGTEVIEVHGSLSDRVDQVLRRINS